jgi:hypothetical protein
MVLCDADAMLIRSALQFDAGQHIVCGIALGYADPTAPENAVRAERLVPWFFCIVR